MGQKNLELNATRAISFPNDAGQKLYLFHLTCICYNGSFLQEKRDRSSVHIAEQVIKSEIYKRPPPVPTRKSSVMGRPLPPTPSSYTPPAPPVAPAPPAVQPRHQGAQDVQPIQRGLPPPVAARPQAGSRIPAPSKAKSQESLLETR